MEEKALLKFWQKHPFCFAQPSSRLVTSASVAANIKLIFIIQWIFCFAFLLWPGLREYFAANPALTYELPSTVVKSKASETLIIQSEHEDSEPGDEFYDALARGESFKDEDSDDDDDATSPKVNTIVRN